MYLERYALIALLSVSSTAIAMEQVTQDEIIPNASYWIKEKGFLRCEHDIMQAMKFDERNENIQYELLSYHLNDAMAQLSELTGKSISEKGMDAIFREFCVGK